MTQMSPKKNFIFFGEDAFSLAVLESLVEGCVALQPIATVMLEPISVSGRRLAEYCDSRCIPLIKTRTVRSEDFLTKFDKLDYDLVVCAHFQRILPARIFGRARVGALNLHPSLLPKYRGMAPQHWPIILGEAETGVTVHRIDDGVDMGRIMRQVRIILDPEIYIHELQTRFLAVYRTIMIEAVERLLSGEPGEEQTAAGSSYFHKIQESDMEIHAGMSVARAYSMVRAFSFPYPGARYDGVRIMKAKPVSKELRRELQKSARAPGVHTVGADRYLILNDGALELTKWRNA
jgi:methionyl-tRNA formyltransferase